MSVGGGRRTVFVRAYFSVHGQREKMSERANEWTLRREKRWRHAAKLGRFADWPIVDIMQVPPHALPIVRSFKLGRLSRGSYIYVFDV